MKNRLAASLSVILAAMFLLTSCSAGTNVPDLSGSDSESAKTVIATLGLVPVLEERHSETVEAGMVVTTKPAAGESAPAGSQVSIVVSKGPKRITSEDASAGWDDIRTDGDWNYDAPYIEDGNLFLEIFDVGFLSKVKWHDPSENGEGFGEATINDSFDKIVPVSLVWEKQTHNAGQQQNITIEIPVSDLEEKRPTDISIRLFAYVDGYYRDITFSITLTW